MLIRGPSTEQRIAEIAQRFGQGLGAIGQSMTDQAKVQDNQTAQMLQAEARRRQEAVQVLDLAAKLTESTGRQWTPDIIKPMLDKGDFSGIGITQERLPVTPKFQRAEEERILNNEYKKSVINKNNRAGGAKKGETENGTQLKPTEIKKFNEGNALPAMLDDLGKTIDNNTDIFGPVAGRISGFNPYNEKVKTADSQITASAQAVGKYLEGGVLRAEDVPKYRKMLPDLTDTPEVARNKLTNVKRLLIQRQNSDIAALKGSGYDTNSIDRGFVAPETPSILNTKPRVVSQNGHTYTLNPATGKYE